MIAQLFFAKDKCNRVDKTALGSGLMLGTRRPCDALLPPFETIVSDVAKESFFESEHW